MTNDQLLKQYPFNTTPETWPLNDIFLRSIERMQAGFAEEGYSWQWGLEIEFGPMSAKAFADRMKIEKIGYDGARILSPYAGPSLDLHERLLKTESSPTLSHDLAKQLIGYIERAHVLAPLIEATGNSKQDMIEEIRGYQQALSDTDASVSELARMNIYMAHLHVMPSRMGGLRDIIEPRFGSIGRGYGWWDDHNTAEVRLPPTGDPATFIQNYHRMMQIVYETAERHRVVPVMDVGTGHVHFSLWRQLYEDKAPYNSMAMVPGDYDIGELKDVLTNTFFLLMQTPHLVKDYDPQDPAYDIVLNTSPDKGFSFRQADQSWELRRSYQSNFMHLARDIAMIMGGFYGPLRPMLEMTNEECVIEAAKNEAQRDPETGLTPLDKFNGLYFDIDRSLVRMEFLKAKDKFRRVCDPFTDLIRHSLNINNEGLITSEGLVERVLPALRAQLGEEKLKLFAQRDKDGKEYDLGTAKGWVFLLKSLRIKSVQGAEESSRDKRLEQLLAGLEDMVARVPEERQTKVTYEKGTLDTSHLHPDLQVYFEPVMIDGVSENLYSRKYFATHLGAYSLNRTLAEIVNPENALAVFLTPDETRQIANFYKQRIPQRLQEMSERLIQQAALSLAAANPDEDDYQKRLSYIFRQVVWAVYKEESNAEEVIIDDPVNALSGAKTLLELRDRSNTIKMLRPYFHEAARVFTAEQRALPQPNNLLISGMQDAVSFLEKDILDLQYHAKKIDPELVRSVQAELLRGENVEDIQTGLKRSYLPVFSRLALSEPHFTRDDVVRMLEKERQIALEQLVLIKRDQSSLNESCALIEEVVRTEYATLIKDIQDMPLGAERKQGGDAPALIVA